MYFLYYLMSYYSQLPKWGIRGAYFTISSESICDMIIFIGKGGACMFLFEVDENIVLRQLRLQEAPELFQLINGAREYLREWLPWVDTTRTPEDSLAFIDHSMQAFEDERGLTAGIYYRGKLAGLISYNNLDWANKVAYVGYWLAPDYQGYGIMTNAVRALTDYAFTAYGLNRIDIRAAFENKKSRAIPKRLGFQEEGQIRQAEWLYDHFVDHVVYGMLASEWRKQ